MAVNKRLIKLNFKIWGTNYTLLKFDELITHTEQIKKTNIVVSPIKLYI